MFIKNSCTSYANQLNLCSQAYRMMKGPVSKELSKAMSALYCGVGRMNSAMDMGSWDRPMKEGGTGTV